jgi:hypothetical protein
MPARSALGGEVNLLKGLGHLFSYSDSSPAQTSQPARFCLPSAETLLLFDADCTMAAQTRSRIAW